MKLDETKLHDGTPRDAIIDFDNPFDESVPAKKTEEPPVPILDLDQDLNRLYWSRQFVPMGNQ